MLNSELRIKSGLTYGASSRFEQRSAACGRNPKFQIQDSRSELAHPSTICG
jgi:hypothetical protein